MAQYSNLTNGSTKYQSSYLKDYSGNNPTNQPAPKTGGGYAGRTPSLAAQAELQRQHAIDTSSKNIYNPTLTQAQQNYYNSQAEMANEQGRLLQSYMNQQAGLHGSPDNPTTETPVDNGGNVGGTVGGTVGGGSNGGGTVDNTPNDYWAQYYAAIQAQQEAQRRQAEEAYNRVLNQLSDSLANSQNVINQNSDEALRQAYVNSMQNRKGLASELANQGINGGATESILANLLNAYGNNRASIENTRNNNLNSLLANYNQAVADAGATYANGLGSVDSNYFNNLASGLLNQAQSADSLRNALASRSGGSSSASSASVSTPTVGYDRAAVLKGLKNYDDDFNNADAYMRMMGVPESDLEGLYLESGLGNYDEAKNQAAVNNFNKKISGEDLKTVLRNLGQMGNVANGDILAKNYMDQIVDAYNLTDDEARYILAQARI